MPMLALVLPFLKTWWKVILPIVLLLAALGYVKILYMEINHYKSEVVALQLEKKAAAAKTSQLEQNAENISKMYRESLKNQFAIQESQGQAVRERIAKNETSKHVILDSDIVGLFNSSKPSIKLKDPAITVSGNDGRSASTKNDSKSITAANEEEPLAFEHTLNELLDIAAYNDGNHVKCIATVREWQGFWKDYTESYKAVANAP